MSDFLRPETLEQEAERIRKQYEAAQGMTATKKLHSVVSGKKVSNPSAAKTLTAPTTSRRM